ncbi:hypothetical protein B0D78_09225 [Pyramidobacter sp. C12-8]|nr:hypothetical protein B0D78_09225 [Pyramidobacter sp. C12-8]
MPLSVGVQPLGSISTAARPAQLASMLSPGELGGHSLFESRMRDVFPALSVAPSEWIPAEGAFVFRSIDKPRERI